MVPATGQDLGGIGADGPCLPLLLSISSKNASSIASGFGHPSHHSLVPLNSLSIPFPVVSSPSVTIIPSILRTEVKSIADFVV